MPNTHLSIQGSQFLINGRPIYADLPHCDPSVQGLLMNARFIQGIFDDATSRDRYARFGHSTFDPDENTNALIRALPSWYEHGLRAFTVGLQGGGPCFTIDNATIDNNPFGPDGSRLDPAYAARLDRLIRAADAVGMVVIVSYLYVGQTTRLRDEAAVRHAVMTASRFLREGAYANVLIEVGNEHNLMSSHRILWSPEGMAELIALARRESGGLVVGCSGSGGHIDRAVIEASDVALIHGNGCSRQRLYNLIRQTRAWAGEKPIVCNEDSPAIGNLVVAMRAGASWGYYNNISKQEPPADWSITAGEDRFFAWRLAESLGLPVSPIPPDEQFYLAGLEPHMTAGGKRWLRLASLYPETVDFVEFFRNSDLIYTVYDEPFSLFMRDNWYQEPWIVQPDDREWLAVVHLRDGEVVEIRKAVESPGSTEQGT